MNTEILPELTAAMANACWYEPWDTW